VAQQAPGLLRSDHQEDLMQNASRIGTVVFAAITGCGAAAQSAEPGRPESIEPGLRPSYVFREAPINARGVRSLADLEGRPVLIEFWGTR
jgi:hypothetical protein